MTMFTPARTLLQNSTVLTSVLAIMTVANTAYAGPQGGVVVGGTATIVTNGNHTQVNQSSQNGVYNWNSFNIAGHESMDIAQPNSGSRAFNRVVGAQAPSTIAGKLTSNGNVIISNSMGVVFAGGADVNVGGLVATTADADDDNIMNGGTINFNKAGNVNAVVQNSGKIKVADGGLALLVGPNVTNDGMIQANLGKAQLASGETFTVDMYGDGLISLQASDKLNKQLVQNSGTIAANGGQVLLTAAAAQNAVESVINMDGIIEANSIGTKGGKVVLVAEGQGSKTLVAGKINAKGGTGQKGGTVDVLGDNVALLSGSKIDASGDIGGGKVRVGGDFHGAGNVKTATNTVVQTNAKIFANALTSGKGGDVAVWANNNTFFYGDIEAKGGANGGNGGFVETSGSYLEAFGGVDASAANGTGGTWLLDPVSLTITDDSNNDNLTIPDNSNGPTFTSSSSGAVASRNRIQNALNGGNNVIVQTGGGTGGEGNITVAADITKTGGNSATLTLLAHNDIVFNNNVDIVSTSNKLNVVLNANSDSSNGGAIRMTSGSSIVSNGGNITLGGGASPATTPASGSNNYDVGVSLNDTELNAGGGNIIINGTGRASNDGSDHGVLIENGSDIRTSGSGTITITGNGGGGSGNSQNDNNYGVYIKDSETQIRAQNGNITITGIGGGNNQSNSDNNYGINLNNGVEITNNGSGTIILSGTAGGDKTDSNYGIRINNGTNEIRSTSGEIQFLADRVDIDGNNLEVSTSGNVLLRPLTASTTIGLGGASGGLQLGDTLLDSIDAGTITIGSLSGTGNIEADGHDWDANLQILSGSGNIVIDGTQDMGNHTFLARTASGDIEIANDGKIESSASGTAVTLVAQAGDFSNDNGANAIETPNGRWLIYSTKPANNTYDGLASDFFRYSCTYGGACPSFAAEPGNGFLYTDSPVVTVTLTPDAKTTTYGQAAPTLTYTFSGYNAGDEAADTRGGSANIYTDYVIGMNAGQYDITVDVGSLTSSLGYTFVGSVLDNGLTVNKANVTITAGNQNVGYAGGFTLGNGFGTTALYGSDSVTGVVYNTNATFSGSSNYNAGTWTLGIGNATGTGGFNTTNYNITYVGGSLVITPKALYVDANASNKQYDGNTDATVTGYSYTGLVGADAVTASHTGATFDGKDVAPGRTVTVTGISISGADAGNYTFNTTDTTTADITKRGLTIALNDQNVTYGDVFTLGNGFSATGLQGVESVDGITYSSNSTGQVSGSGKTRAGTWTLDGSSATGSNGFDINNYEVTYDNANLNIAQFDVNASFTAGNKVYDGNNSASMTGFGYDKFMGDQVTVGFTNLTFADANVANGKTVTMNGVNLTGADAANYKVTTPVTTTANITPKGLTITVANQNAVYADGSSLGNGFSANGLVGSENVTGLTYGSNATLSTSGNRRAGTWSLTGSNAVGDSGFNAGNYSINYVNGTLTIAKRILNVAAAAQNKVYDGNRNATVTLSNDKVALDKVNNGFSQARFDTKDAGPGKTVTVTGITMSGADSSNYTLGNTTATTLADITRANLTVRARNVLMGYGDGNDYDGFTTNGLKGSDSITSADLTNNAGMSGSGNWNASGLFTPWTIFINNASGANFNPNNYNITYVNGNLTIARKLMLIGADGHDKPYDATTDATVTLTDNRIGGDVFNATYGNAQFIDKNVGNNKLITVTGLGISGADANNYVIANPFGITLGTADITKAALTITANNRTQTYGDGDAFNGADVNGLQGGETFTNVALDTNATQSTSGNWNAGTWDITASGGTGGNGFMASNYAVSYVDGTLTVDKRNLNADATGVDKTYDGTRTANVTFTDDRITNDIIDYSYNARFGNKNAGNNKNVNVTNIAISGTDAANYNLVSSTDTTTADIFKRLLTVTADAADKVYDATRDATVTLSDDRVAGDVIDLDFNNARFDNKNVGTNKEVTVSGISKSGSDASNYYFDTNKAIAYADITPYALTINASGIDKVYDGNRRAQVSFTDDRFAGDTFNIRYKARFNNKNVGNDKPVSVYDIVLKGGDSGNYTYNFTTGTIADITPATLTVIGNSQTKIYGQADPFFSYIYSGLKGRDTASVFSGALDRVAGEHVAGGPYAINLGTLNAGGNYIINYLPGAQLTITPATLQVFANNQSITMGQNIPPLTFTASGFGNGDGYGIFTGGLTTVPRETLPGTYGINRGTLAANSDYIMVYNPGFLTINSPFGNNTNTQEQTSEFNSANYRGPAQQGSLLQMAQNAPAPTGGLGNLAPAAGGEGLDGLEPAAGGTTSLLDCSESAPCEAVE